MGSVVDNVVNVASLGTIDDFSGAKAARRAGSAAERRGIALADDMYGRQTEQADSTYGDMQGGINTGMGNVREGAQQWDLKNLDVYGGMMDRGEQAGQQMMGLAGQPLDVQSFYDPSYQFRMDQGLEGIQRQMAASGMGQSGAAMKGAGRFASDLASQEYGNAFGRAQSDRQMNLSNLSNLYGTGAGAAGSYASSMSNPMDINQQEMGLNLANIGQYGDTMQSSLRDLGAGYGVAQSNAVDVQAAQQSGSNAMIGSLATLGASFIPSDPRLKENIKKIGKLKSGLGWYSYNYVWSDEPLEGVMSTEVREFMPEAVNVVDGYDTVRYDLVLAGE